MPVRTHLPVTLLPHQLRDLLARSVGPVAEITLTGKHEGRVALAQPFYRLGWPMIRIVVDGVSMSFTAALSMERAAERACDYIAPDPPGSRRTSRRDDA